MGEVWKFATSPWGYVLIGIVPIVLILMITGHAKLQARDPGSGHAGCPDWRVTKDVLVFGGASAYTFGWYWFLASWWLGETNPLSKYVFVYGILQLVLSAVQTLTLFVQILLIKDKVIPLKSHLEGCGYTTAWGPFWALYWLGKFSWFKGITVFLRDLITRVDYVASLPMTLLFSGLAKVLLGKSLIPVIRHVDHAH